MLRCTIEIVPYGDESRAKPIGLVLISNDGTGDKYEGNYNVYIKKSAPFKGALVTNWLTGVLWDGDVEVMKGKVEGFKRGSKGPYDLLYQALKACEMEKRNKEE